MPLDPNDFVSLEPNPNQGLDPNDFISLDRPGPPQTVEEAQARFGTVVPPGTKLTMPPPDPRLAAITPPAPPVPTVTPAVVPPVSPQDDVSTLEGLRFALQRGIKTAGGIPDIVQAIGTQGMERPTFRQERRAFEAAMGDPRYMEGLIEAGDDPVKRLRAEALRGPSHRLRTQMAPRTELQKALAQDVIQRQKDIAALPKSAAQKRLEAATTTGEKWKAFLQDPIELSYSVALESLPSSVVGAISGIPGGPAGVAAGAGGASGLATLTSEFLGNARAAGVDMEDPESFRAFLNDDAKFNEAFSKALTKAAPVAGLDAASAGAAGKFLAPALRSGLRAKVLASGKELAQQAVAGMTGEAAGQALSGQDFDTFDIAVEGIAELAGAPAEVASNLRAKAREQRTLRYALQPKTAQPIRTVQTQPGEIPVQVPTEKGGGEVGVGRGEAQPAVRPISGESHPQGTTVKAATASPEIQTTTAIHPESTATVEFPIERLKLSKDVPNFKAGASEETGVVTGEQLAGKYERKGTAPIVVWERLNGDHEVITGRHRLDLARRTGEKTIPSQIVREADGFTKDMALTFDAEANIRDGQGAVADYATYFKGTNIDAAEARSRGLLSRVKAKAGWSLAKAASDDVYALWRDGKLTDAQAVAISDAAPGDAQAQQVGSKFALQGKSADFVSNVIKASTSEAAARGQTLDLFGKDDAAMQQMVKQAETATKLQKEIAEQIRAVQGAAKRPEIARKMGVDVKDPDSVSRKIAELKSELARWENWPLHEDLVAKVKGEPVPSAEAEASPTAPAAQIGERVKFTPHAKKGVATEGIVQDVLNDGRGLNIFSPLPDDPSRVVRVWLEDGKLERMVPAARARTSDTALAEPATEDPEHIAENRKSVSEEIDVVDEGGEGDPVRRNWEVHRGDFMTIDWRNNRIIVRRQPYERWLKSMRRRGLSEDQIQTAVRSRLAEESIHLKVDDDVAERYWNLLTRLEQRIIARRYARDTSDLNAAQFGHEALRFRMQQAMNMTPSEFAEMARLERWTWQGLTALEQSVRFLREKLTHAGTAQRELFDKALANIETAKTVSRAAAPAARFREPTQDELAPDNEKILTGGSRPAIGEKYFENAGDQINDPEFWVGYTERMANPNIAGQESGYQAAAYLRRIGIDRAAPAIAALREARNRLSVRRRAFIEKHDALSEARNRNKAELERATDPAEKARLEQEASELKAEQMEMFRSPEFALANVVQFPREIIEDAFETGSASKTRRIPHSRGAPLKEPDFIPETKEPVTPAARMRDTGTPELPMGEAQPGAERAVPTTRVTPDEVFRQSYAFLQEATTRLVGAESPGDLPTFNEFVDAMKGKIPGVKRGQLAEMWERSVYTRLMNASGEVLAAMRRAAGIEGKFGDRAIADPPKRKGTTLEQEVQGREAKEQVRSEKKGVVAAQRYRNKVIERIAEKMLGSIQKEFDLDRRTIGTDELRYSSPNAFVDIDPIDLKNPGVLSKILSDEARVGPNTPVSNTKRVTVLQDKQTGRAYVVSTFLDGRRGVVLMDPASPQATHATLADILKRYRPVASMLLDEPVRNYKKRYDNLADFENQFGQRARESASQETRYDQATLEAEQAPTAFEQMAKSPLTADEAGSVLDFVYDEVNSIDSPADFKAALDALTFASESGRFTRREWQVANALYKAFQATERRYRDANLTEEQVISQTLDELYDTAKNSQTREEFVSNALGRFAGETEPVVSKTEAAATPGEAGREVTTLRTKAPTFDPGAELRKGPNPEPQLSPPVTPEMLSEEAQKAVNAEAESNYRSLPKSLYAQLAHRKVPQQPRTVGKPISVKQAFETPPAGRMRDAWQWGTEQTLRSIKDVISAPLAWYSGWMINKLRESGGTVAKRAATLFNVMVDREKELYGDLADRVLDDARRSAGKMNKGTQWLHGLRDLGNGTARMRSVDAMEGRIPIPAFAQALIDKARNANLEIGRMLQPVIPGFLATGKFQRNLTAFGYDLIRQGHGEIFDNWTRSLARINGVPIGKVQGFFRKWKETLNEPTPDPNRIEKINQDFQRVFPEVVTHVKAPGLGARVWEPVVHADLFNYLETAARRATHIRAFREAFPNNPVGKTGFARMDKGLRRELSPSHIADYDALLRTLQGHPTDNYSNVPEFLSPGRVLPQIGSLLNRTLGNVMARAVLTGQMFVQPGENIAGSTPVFLGYRNYLEALARVKQLYPELEKAGAVNRVMYDFSIDPTSPMRTLSKLSGNLLSKGFAEQFLNELQEATAAATARVVRERIQSHQLSRWEQRMLPQTFKAMGFTPDEINAMMAGTDPQLLGQFERKASAFLTGGNKAISEGSKLGANRLFNSVFRFQTYPMMKMNQFRSLTRNAVDAWRGGSTADKVNSTRMLVRFMFGNTVQGAITAAITALFFDGLLGLKIKGEEAEDEPLKFLAESFLASMSGPFYLMWRGARRNGVKGVGEQATRAMFPYAMVRDLMDAAHGAGSYKDQDTTSKIGTFLEKKLPGVRGIRGGMALFGLSQDDRDLDSSKKAFYRWRRENLGFRETDESLEDQSGTEFRIAMRKAVEAMSQGDQQAFLDSSLQAFKQKLPPNPTNEDLKKAQQSIAQSLRGRTLLKTPDGKQLSPEQFDALRARIGEDAFRRLVYNDLMLDAAADFVSGKYSDFPQPYPSDK